MSRGARRTASPRGRRPAALLLIVATLVLLVGVAVAVQYRSRVAPPADEAQEPSPDAPPQEPPSEDDRDTPDDASAEQVREPVDGLWLAPREIAALPMRGAAWDALTDAAERKLGKAKIADKSNEHNIRTLANALVYARTGREDHREKAAEGIEDAIGTEEDGRTLALGRNLPAYVIAADLIDLADYDDELDDDFRTWLEDVRSQDLDGRTLISTHEERPNNWGTHAGAARVAASAYLGDEADLAEAAEVFKAWLGARALHDDFEFGEDLSWQCNPREPVGVNPAGCTKDGHDIGGVLPDDQRRSGEFRWPPPQENYVWESLQGATVQAELLHRQGYPAWEWEDAALLRVVEWLHEQADFPAEGDDTWQPWLINHAYRTSFPAESPTRSGKNMGWTDWTHGSQRG